jgi:hypothetical protein
MIRLRGDEMKPRDVERKGVPMSAPGKALSAAERKKFEEARERWSKKCRHLTDPIDRSERLTEADLAIRINSR